ncbi:hypothetical protein SAMN03159423_4521 [Bradyrhizobium sp. NFR13]|uniref:hypothetical protein n=1 Tax=Bradyrhizobium sp. NFR13 TaxID=1566285 RepID=UPI0008E45FB3|nr:hypothetical protein [Bradyrhizobium sp. NFR13]SFL93758.1 hypothetical protein SAMN03159423_4521 [Bradyrhizobium sp. NFR13]
MAQIRKFREHHQVLTAEFGIGSNGSMSKSSEKFAKDRPYAKPDAAAARLLEIAKAIGADRRGMIPIGAWNATFLNRDKASAAEYALGRNQLIASGLIEMHASGGYIIWGPNCDPADRTEMGEEFKLPAASLGL